MPDNEAELRAEVRAFLAKMRAQGVFELGPAGRAEVNKAFCLELGKAGYLGMTWPKKYGGHERSALERYIVTEELLANGAPIRAMQAADRQNGPMILHFGTEWQRETFLPKFASGEAGCAIGLSEPDSGSDLAAIRTKAVKVDGGWKVNGRKVWTNSAHYSAYMTLLARTGEAAHIANGFAHQLHGAMGFTQEHALHRSSRRLWAWRDEFGDEAEWAAWVERIAVQLGSAGLWPFLTARDKVLPARS